MAAQRAWRTHGAQFGDAGSKEHASARDRPTQALSGIAIPGV